MGRKAEPQSDVNPKEFEKMERKLEETNAKLSDLRSKISILEEESVDLENKLQISRTRKNKLAIEIQSYRSLVPMIQDQVKNQEVKYREAALDQKKLNTLNKVDFEMAALVDF